MNVAFIVYKFPYLSQSFILSQVVGLLERGHTVHIYAIEHGGQEKVHPDVIKYGLMERCFFPPRIPANAKLAVAKALLLLIKQAGWRFGNLLPIIRRFVGGRRGFWALIAYSAVPLLQRKNDYDIIHCHFGPRGLTGVLFRQLGGKGKLVTSFHGIDVTADLNTLGRHVYDELFERGDLFLPISERWKTKLMELGCREEKIVVQHMGVDCSKFAYRERKLVKGEPVVIVTTARLVEKKGVEYGIRAVANVSKKYPHICYRIIGDGPLRDPLLGLVHTLNAQEHIQILGWKNEDEVRELLDQAHLLLAPSVTALSGDQEGIPVVLMEAMAMGLPVVSTQHSGIPELVENDVAGLLVPERDVEALTAALEQLIAQPEGWSEMGFAGRKYVEQEFDNTTQNDRLTTLYERCIGTP